MKIKSYTSLNKSTKASARKYLINLKEAYGSETELPLLNNQGKNFYIFLEPLESIVDKFEKYSSLAITKRNINIDEYLSSGYIVSEINSSLKAEGVHSSRKIVDAVLKAKKEGGILTDDEITKLISNYYDALNFILSGKKITSRNIFTLYGIVSADLPNVIEEGNFYRSGEVTIGRDEGMIPKSIKSRVEELIDFISDAELENSIHIKAIVAHYIFENIHPYYEYNGRMGRLLHLWILINKSRDEFWKMTYLSEAIFSYKNSFDHIFDEILKAKKSEANIDLTYFVGSLLNIFNDHTEAYLQMKEMAILASKKPSRHLRLFIIDMLCDIGADGKWYSIRDFKNKCNDYSQTVYDRLLKEIKLSGLFETRGSRPIEFRLKMDNIKAVVSINAK